jgi:hypothetical protein
VFVWEGWPNLLNRRGLNGADACVHATHEEFFVAHVSCWSRAFLTFLPRRWRQFISPEKVGGLLTGIYEDARQKVTAVRASKPYFYTSLSTEEEVTVFCWNRTKRGPQFEYVCYIIATDQSGVSKT